MHGETLKFVNEFIIVSPKLVRYSLQVSLNGIDTTKSTSVSFRHI